MKINRSRNGCLAQKHGLGDFDKLALCYVRSGQWDNVKKKEKKKSSSNNNTMMMIIKQLNDIETNFWIERRLLLISGKRANPLSRTKKRSVREMTEWGFQMWHVRQNGAKIMSCVFFILCQFRFAWNSRGTQQQKQRSYGWLTFFPFSKQESSSSGIIFY